MGPEVLDVQAWSHGELWMLAAALAMALGTVISRYACRHSDPVAVTGWHMLLGGLPLLAGSALQPQPFWPAWNPLEWGLMAYAALLGSAVAYGLFFWFANHGDLTSFTSLTFLTPVFALLCGVVWLQEQLQPLQWLGAALALVSVVLINRRSLLWQPVEAELVS
jgi:drug/metabolite transporter (DMT)-like permease